MKVLEGNHGLQRRCPPLAEKKSSRKKWECFVQVQTQLDVLRYSPACLIVLMVDAGVSWTAEFQVVFGSRSLSVGPDARAFVDEGDSFCALQACIEGVHMVAIETVTTQTSVFVSSTGNFNIIA